jgi:hypothetical protein
MAKRSYNARRTEDACRKDEPPAAHARSQRAMALPVMNPAPADTALNMSRCRQPAVKLEDLKPRSSDDFRRARRITGASCPYTPIGFDPESQEAWILDCDGRLRALRPRDLTYRCLQLACGITWLRERYPVRWSNKQPTGHFDVGRAAGDLVQACRAMGPFNLTMLVDRLMTRTLRKAQDS